VQVETREHTMTTIASFHQISSEVLRKHYKHKVSGYSKWNQREHCESYMIFPENIGVVLSIDEVSLSKGELYTFVTNKAAKSKNGTIVACIKGTKSEDVINVLKKIPLEKRMFVKEVTLDMANNMENIVRMSFPEAMLTTDHFHVIRLAMEAMQHVRVKLRWEELDKENKEIEQAKINGLKYKPIEFTNGDSPKQLLARSKYILCKKTDEWTSNQKHRAELLFKQYPQLEKAYYHVLQLRSVYKNKDKMKAKEQLDEWLEKNEKMPNKEFRTVAYTIKMKQESILNYFANRNTNANAESFNAKIKLFRANLRGVKEIPFFLFRLTKLYA
jgi:transposase